MIEYKVRPVGRFVVTQFYSDDESHTGKAGSRIIGEYDRHQDAELVARALARADGGQFLQAPDNDIPTRLRAIAEEDGRFCEHGIVVLRDRSGRVRAFSMDVKDPSALLEAGLAEIDRLEKLAAIKVQAIDEITRELVDEPKAVKILKRLGQGPVSFNTRIGRPKK